MEDISMNEISIIIDGVRYDAVEATKKELNDFDFISCHYCDLYEHCEKYDCFDMCGEELGSYKYFKKYNKKQEE